MFHPTLKIAAVYSNSITYSEDLRRDRLHRVLRTEHFNDLFPNPEFLVHCASLIAENSSRSLNSTQLGGGFPFKVRAG